MIRSQLPQRTGKAALGLFIPIFVAGIAGSFLPGLAALVTPGDTIASHSRSHTEEPGTTPSDGEYILVHKYGDPTPLKTASLNTGDRLGFMSGQTGQIIAVAGEDEWIYTDNDYLWIRRAK